MNKLLTLLLAAHCILLSGCTTMGKVVDVLKESNENPAPTRVATASKATEAKDMAGMTMNTESPSKQADSAVRSGPQRIAKLTAVGYGATSSYDGYTVGQRRLMAMRASKLDAYRSLAEQVYGVRVAGNSTVAAMMAQNDSFRVFVDAYLRGARVVSITPMADGNYETIMELAFEEATMRSFVAPPANSSSPSATALNNGNCSAKGAGSQDCGYSSSFYYSE